MNKLFWTFLAFILFNISFQLELECSSFLDPTCGGHNTDYKLKCQKFTSLSNCITVEVDEFCKIDSSTHECSEEDNIRDGEICTDFGDENKCKRVKLGDNCNLDALSDCVKVDESIHPTKKCEFDFYKKNCREVDKTCTDYSDATCGDIGIKNGIQCAKLSSSEKCKEITVDNYCEIKNFNCVKKEGQNFDETKYKCDLDGQKCERREILCEEYTDATCGDRGIKNGIQCAKLSSSEKCKEITVDNYCEIKNFNCVKKEGQNFDETKYKCDLFNQKCERREILCIEKTDATKCREVINQNCQAIHLTNGGPLTCRVVEVDGECKIEDGDCSNGNTIAAYKQCSFNDTNKSGCKATIKSCNVCTPPCLNCKTSNGYTCSEIPTNQCKEILIHESCKVKPEDGTCTLKEESANGCEFNSDSTICLLVDSHCSYTTSSDSCVDKTDSDAPPAGKKCFLINNSECGLIDKDCQDFTTSEDCENYQTKNCFWYTVDSVSKCVEYTTDSYCEIREGLCKKKSTASSFNENEDCLFSKEISENPITKTVSCTKKDKCLGSWEDCSDNSIPNEISCIEGNGYCKKIEIDTHCYVDDNGLCSPNDPNFVETTGLCVFNDGTEKNSCKLRTRLCTEYTLNTCGNLQNCAYYSSDRHCIETDNYCTMNENVCSKRTDVTEQPTKKCLINSDGVCAQTDKLCGEIDVAQCNNVPRKDNQQCFHFTDEAECKTIIIDEYCYVNSDGECTNSKKISQYEYCGFNTGKTECTIKEKKCEDYNDELCGKFNPETKLCFNFGSGCIEVQVDNRCKINEKNECVAKGSGQCGFDENNEKCYLKKSDGRYLTSLKYFLLLSLFLMF